MLGNLRNILIWIRIWIWCHFLNRIDLDAHQILVYERALVFFYKDAYLPNI